VREPGEIRVLAADGLNRALIQIEGPVKVTTETGSVLATGTPFQVGGGKTLTVTRGIGPSSQPVLQLTTSATTFDAKPGDKISIPFNASRAARVSVELDGPNGIILTTTETSYVSGSNTVSFPLVDGQNKPLPPGAYTATVLGFDGLDHVRSTPIAITIPAPNLPPSNGGKPKTTSALPYILAAIGVVVVLGGAAWRVRARSSRT